MDRSTELAGQLCARALDWLARVRTCFALPPDTPPAEIDLNAVKAVGELALAAHVVTREAVAGPSTADTARALLDFAWTQVRDGELLYAMQKELPAATYPMEICGMFHAAGYEHPGLERFLAHLVTLRAAAVPEVVPNRQLALVASARRIGLTLPVDPADITARTWLGGRPEPWLIDTYNAYTVTHTVFHLTDYGQHREGLPAHLQDYLHRWLPVWVDVFTEARQWDLLGELLIVDLCLDRPDHYPRVWAELAAAQREDGLVPNGMTRPPADATAAFVNHHHSTIVAIVASTMLVSRAVDGALPVPA